MPRRVSSFSFLALLFAAVVVPLLAFGGSILYRYAGSEAERYRREALVAAHQVTAAVDRELEGLISTIETLATSRLLRAGDFRAFHGQVQELARDNDLAVVLRDGALAQILNSMRPFGPPVANSGTLPGLDRSALSDDRPFVSGVFRRDTNGVPAIAVYLPIRIGDEPYLLGVSRDTESLLRQITSSIPPGWLVGVGDTRGNYVLRSKDNQRWSGQPGLPEYLAKASGREGTFTSINVEGVELLAGYVYSDMSGWLIAVNIPYADVRRPLEASVGLFIALGVFALVLSGTLAVLVGRHLTSSMSDLAAKALAVGRGEVIEANRSVLRELELAGRSLSRASRDLAERAREQKAAMRHQQLLTDELNHRVKNTLASVQAMVTQTLRNTSSVDAAREAVTARLIALARAQDVLTRENWEGADIREVVETALDPHRGAGRRFEVTGPPVRLGPKAALALSLALHELGTNAVKYGALSVDGGLVRIVWTVAETEPRRFLMSWTETGGPRVEPPTRRGFGSRLIERGLGSELLATVVVTYDPAGLVFTMETDLSVLEDTAGSVPLPTRDDGQA